MPDLDGPDPRFVEQLWARMELEAFGPVRLELSATEGAWNRQAPRRVLLVATAAAVASLLVLTVGALPTSTRSQSELDVARMLPTPGPTAAVDGPMPQAVPQGVPVAAPAARPTAPVDARRAPAAAPAPVSVSVSAPAPAPAVDADRDRAAPAAPVDELLFHYRENPADRVGVPFDVARMSLDGEQRVVVLTGDRRGTEVTPDWAPDGQRMVYASRNRQAHDHVQLYVREADGSERRLTDDPCEQTESMSCGDVGPAWSPTGDVIAFDRGYSYAGCRREVDDCGTIMLVPAHGGTPVPLTRGAGASWSPDGRQLVFADTDNGVDEASCDGTTGCATSLFVISRDGSGRRALGVRGSDPRWSPDGSRIAYTHTGASGSSVRTVTVDGTDDAAVTGPGHGQPTWSPDGRTIVTSKYTNGQWDLWSTDVASARSTQITDTPAMELSPVFRPRPGQRLR